MAYRDVTINDVGKLVEVRDSSGGDWHIACLEHTLSKPDSFGYRYLCWVIEGGEVTSSRSAYRYARISTTKLPEGFLPLTWREVVDSDVIRQGDACVMIPNDPKATFHPSFINEIHESQSRRNVRDFLDSSFRGGVVIRPQRITMPNPHF